ncbi:MAG: hypothetical protein QOJ15_9856, partial [Bradyrhizobium sp.]|nr:hypothetical protein [Bradyrhizobium sp.]
DRGTGDQRQRETARQIDQHRGLIANIVSPGIFF